MNSNGNWAQALSVHVGDEHGSDYVEDKMSFDELEEFIFGLPDLDTPCLPQQQKQQTASLPSCQRLQSVPLERYDSSGGHSFQSTNTCDSYHTAPMSMGSWDAPFSPYGSFDPSMNMLSPAAAYGPSWAFDSRLTTPFSLPTSPGMDYTISPASSFDPSPILPPAAPTSFPSLPIPELDLAAQRPCAAAAAPAPSPTSPSRPRACSSSTNIPCPHCPRETPKAFKRRADLSRHIDHMHSIPTQNFPCDYSRCSRRHDPFHRRDHYRDHLREFHREDIEKRGVEEGEAWYQRRNVVKAWWRCSRCLCRVSVGRSGFECHECGGVAGRKRQDLRT
ncbi:uncharacterized protein J7T54_004655 [Emericellopsis cladophorae]|uniref:C2H2-type domain-containing protein n=1 Tax=Emericellopsis cladophorae TaxID=2686198 RepID=A0A9P9Y718_9HYPO|nr:uncharacterized protein J7T54_004655 [Emericellopsis cladophorae]KAI6784109.1 hypothetical protein J7T54_004655 [Emericellopsis cladophorae]